jgi:surface antigen
MRSIVLAAVAGGLALAGCTGGPQETAGAVAGTAAGAVVGSQVGSGSGQVAATAIGALAGGLIGAEIGRSLDEPDRQMALQAEYQALEFGRAGQPVAWRSAGSGNYGEIVVGPSYEVNRLDCREFTHTVYIGGRARVARGTACRQPDATWRIVG